MDSFFTEATDLEIAVLIQKVPVKKIPPKYVVCIRNSVFADYLAATKKIMKLSQCDDFLQKIMEWYKTQNLKPEKKLYTSLPIIN